MVTMPAYYDEKSKTYYCIFRYTDYTGTRRQTTKRGFLRKKDALAYERDFLARVAASPSMPLRELAERYLEDKRINNKEISFRTRESRLRLWVLPYFADQPINDITPADVREWQNALKEATGKTGRPLSDAYLNNIVDECSEMFNYAVRFCGLAKNPIQTAGHTAGKKTIRRDFWIKEEFDRFISTFSPEDPYYTIFMVLYYTGLRIGELQALTPEDVTRDRIRVNKTYHMIQGRDVVTVPKTKKAVRDVLIPPLLADLIDAYKARCYSLSPSERLFPQSDTRIGATFKKHAAQADVPIIRLHDLRHSHASLLIDLGFSALLVSERLGHESVSTTLNIYSHLFPSKQSEAVDRLQKLLSNCCQ